MAGLPEVAGGQGTGLSWMGPGSTFNPIQYAQIALQSKGEKEALDEKKKAENLKLADYKPGEQFNIDLTTNTAEDIQGLQGYFTDKIKEDPNYFNTYSGQLELKNKTSNVGLKDQRRQTQYKNYTEAKKKIDADQGKDLSTDKTYRNLAIYENPETWKNDPSFSPYSKDYEEIKTTLGKDSYYKKNPNRLVNDAREEFRDKHPELLNPVIKTESLTKHIKDNQDVLVNQITTEREAGGVKRKDVKRNRDKTTVTFTNGETQIVPGTDQTATDDYNGDENIKRSVDIHFSDLPETEQKKYQGLENPALGWYKDFVYNTTGDVQSSKTTESQGGFNIGGYSANTSYKIEPFENNQFTSRSGNVGGETTVKGFNLRSKGGANELVLKDINPTYFYQSNKSTQVPIIGGKNMSLEGATPFKAPAFSGNINFETLKSKLEKQPYGSGNAWQGFLKKFGAKYKDADSQGSLDGTLLTDAEVNFLKSAGLGDYIQDKKFARGILSYYTPNEDQTGDVKRYYPGAIVPLEFANSSFIAETGVDFDLALNQLPSGNYSIKTEQKTEDKKSEKSKEKKPDNLGFVEE